MGIRDEVNRLRIDILRLTPGRLKVDHMGMGKQLDEQQVYDLRLLQTRDLPEQEKPYRGERQMLERIALSILASPKDAELLVGDVFVDFLYKYVDSIQKPNSIRAYLKTMTVRRARRQMARLRKHEEFNPDSKQVPALVPRDGDLERKIFRRWLEKCLSKLSDKARKVLKLHFGHDLSYAQIGKSFGSSKQAVGKTVLKSLAVLRKCLEKHRLDARDNA